jgi:hypothetical protein
VESATPWERRTLPFAPLRAAITDANHWRHRDLADLPDAERQAYYRATRNGRILPRSAEALCDAYGWHPREIWTHDEWDQLAEYEATDEREGARRRGRKYRRARKKAAA